MIKEEPHITVGIQHDTTLNFRLHDTFATPEGRTFPAGEYQARLSSDGKNLCLGDGCFDTLTLLPAASDALFDLPQVTIGVEFHWQRQECQTFGGILRLVVDGGEIHAINEVPL